MNDKPGKSKQTTLERTFDGSIEDVWDLWTTREGIEAWWGPDGFEVKVRTLELRPGGRLVYGMTAIAAPQIEFMKRAGMPLTTENTLTYTEITPRSRLVYDNTVDFIPGDWRHRRAPGDDARRDARRRMEPAHGDGLGKRARQARQGPHRREGEAMNTIADVARNPVQANPRRLGASIGAVAAGFATVAVLSTAIDAVLHATGVYPPIPVRMSDGLFVLALTYRGLASVAGGWVTARLAPSRPIRHGVILAAIGTLAGLGGVGVALEHPELGPLWYPIALVVSALPCIAAGVWLRVRGELPA